MIDTGELRRIYKQYGFEEANSNEAGVHVFTIRSGHFHNADIVKIQHFADEEKVFDEFKLSGFACKVRNYKTTSDIEETLFKGFFSVDSTRKKLEREYTRYTDAIAKIHSDSSRYEYINSHYTVNGKVGERNVVDEIFSRLRSSAPTLFLVEAAAGFGKTCTAYELLKSIVSHTDDMVPLFSELSRNRQAKIFRYVLLDEIDRSFPLLRSSLVRSEIRRGNVPVILDGFDELLPQSKVNQEIDSYDSTEPMLETIGELLKQSAKVVLTTRRTAIFDGDEFHSWVVRHSGDFVVYRIKISEPTIQDWIPANRLDELKQLNFPIDRLNNPVLLSYLRCISMSEFNEAVNNPGSIVEKYLGSMLERERKRQDLRVLPGDQYQILKSIANDMLVNNYTSESKEYISDLILSKHFDLLDHARKQYPPEERPSLGELVTKLAGHALLDRNGDNDQGIGFVNEFVLGNFCAEIISEDESGEWLGADRFIEPSVIATLPRDDERKEKLWRALKFSLEFLPQVDRILHTIALTNGLDLDLINDSVENIDMHDVFLGKDYSVENYLFISCSFVNVVFFTEKLLGASFVNCRFFNCGIRKGGSPGIIHVLGCSSDNQEFLDVLQERMGGSEDISRKTSEAELFVLEKFWPKGRATFLKHRPIKVICSNSGAIGQDKILAAISSLRKQRFLNDGEKNSVLELNLDYIGEIKTLLGRS